MDAGCWMILYYCVYTVVRLWCKTTPHRTPPGTTITNSTYPNTQVEPQRTRQTQMLAPPSPNFTPAGPMGSHLTVPNPTRTPSNQPPEDLSGFKSERPK